MPALIKAMQGNAGIALAAAKSLGMMGKSAAPALVRTASRKATPTRGSSPSRRMGQFETDDDAVVAAIVAAAGDPEPQVRIAAIRQIGKIGPPAKDAVNDLLKALNDPMDAMRNEAMEAISKMGDVAVPALRLALKPRNTKEGAGTGSLGPGSYCPGHAVGNQVGRARAGRTPSPRRTTRCACRLPTRSPRSARHRKKP